MREDFFEVLLASSPEIWRGSDKHSLFAIKLSFTGIQNFDGDLLLTFTQADKHLYQLAFTIVPGWVLGCSLANVMLISRIQGARGEFEAIRHATKSCRDIALPHQLMASAHGIAEALDIAMIAGLRIGEFPYGADAELNIKFDYEAFWRSFVSEAKGGFYLVSVPLIEKPLAQIDRVHRRRALSKRKFKAAITETACRRFRKDFRKPSAYSEANSDSTNMVKI